MYACGCVCVCMHVQCMCIKLYVYVCVCVPCMHSCHLFFFFFFHPPMSFKIIIYFCRLLIMNSSHPIHVQVLTNTYQAVLVTDGLVSHTVFIYRCGWMDWGDFAVIGFDAGGEFYANHELSSSLYDNRVACANMPDSEWSNVWYQLNPTDAAIDLPDMPIPNTNIPPPGMQILILKPH